MTLFSRLRPTSFAMILLSLVALSPVWAQEPDPEEAREAAIAARFVTVLEKNPRRGTALDKVYGFHVERGSLDGLLKAYRDKATAAKGMDAASAWMIVGLLESLRGQDAAAVDAFSKAEATDPASYLASYYLGQSLVLVGHPDQAAEALERAIERKPAQVDQLDVFQTLGRVYQRAQKNDKALDVWNRLEKQFPNDARVQEQIATTLLEENEFAAALPRFENLVRITKDKYRQSLFQMEAADIKVRLGRNSDAIREFESLLSQLNPENWLFREVRRRIENVYLRTDDQAGLIAYYEAWVNKHSEDLEAISRLSRLLSGLGRSAEAQSWLEKGLKVAPSRKELRHSLIAQLVFEQKFPEAITQYELLDKYEPNNPDTVRDWGRLILKDPTRDEATRKKDATAVWRRLTSARPADPLVASQVAELFRHAEMVDESLAMYRQAIELAPDQAQYKEYLGEYLHSLKRKEEALATWRQMVAGKAKTAANVARLAEVLAGFGYLAEAIESSAEACRLDPKEINQQIKHVDLLAQANRHDDALKQLDVVKQLAVGDEEREAWLLRDLRERQALGKLDEQIEEIRIALGQSPKPSSEKEKLGLSNQWFWLGRAYEAERQLKEAAEAVAKAGELTPQSIPVLMATARIVEAQNNLIEAVEANTRLAAIDRRYRTEYLKKVAQLEVSLGRRDKAMQAGRDLLAAAPGNPELYEFFSQLCFQLGENDEGLQSLRRSVRVNPSDPKGLLMLAAALAEQFRTSESIELYWRAFEKCTNLDDRLTVIPRLAELYLQTNQFDRLLERLERQRREPDQHREMTICLAQAYQSAGDDGNARQELEKLLTDETRDVQLLMQLVKLCEQDGDLEAAIRFQQQLNKVAPAKDGTMRLAQLLMKSGDTTQATELMTRAAAEEKDAEQLLKSIDSLLSQRNFEQVLAVTQRLVRDQPTNWELLYREGVALASTKPEEAAARFEAILSITLNDDALSLASKNATQQRTPGQRSAAVARPMEMAPLVMRTHSAWQIRQSTGLESQDHYSYSGSMQQAWVPFDFGAARMASLAWLNVLARNADKEADFLKRHRDQTENATERRTMDRYYLVSVRNEVAEQYRILKQLSMRPDATLEIKQMYLQSLTGRGITPNAAQVVAAPGTQEAQVAPLDADELKHVLACYREIEGSADFNVYGQPALQVVAAELKRADRADEADTMLNQAAEAATTPLQIGSALTMAMQRSDYATIDKLLDRLVAINPATTAANPGRGYAYAQHYTSPEYYSQVFGQLMMTRAKEKELTEVLALWDRFLEFAVQRYEAQLKVPKSRTARSNPYGSQGYYSIWRGQGQRGIQLDFPSPNEIYDHASIQTLRQAFEIFKDADATGDLIDHFVAMSDDKTLTATRQHFWRLGLGYLYWWTDDQDEALHVISEVSTQFPENEEMIFELALLHERRSDATRAMELIESLAATDQQSMQKREIAALRLAVNSGNIERARTAAERLFGLRLDSQLQIQLSRQMHQLGMHEQAEAVLSRAGRQAGNKTDVLLTLMLQYQSQGKNDVATQIALQLLRRSSGSTARVAMSPSRGSGDSTRQQALLVLKRSGKLPDLIQRGEEQLSRSPRSQKLIETLIEYYTADGNTAKVAELSAKYAETRGDDPQFQFQLAMQLVQSGKHKESLEHFKSALKKEPRLLRNSYWEIQNAFENAGKLDELADLYEGLDLKMFRQNSYELTNVIDNMSRRDKTKERAVTLFKKAWQDLPDQRAQLLSNLSGDLFWKMPEIYDYARQGIIPTQTSLGQTGTWSGFGQIQSWNGEGKMTTLLSRFLTIATQTKRLDELAVEVEQGREKLKSWQAGTPLLALINLRRGRVDESRAVLEKLLPTMKSAQEVGYYTHWEIAQELSAHESCRDLAIQFLETAIKEPELASGNEFTYTPGRLLVSMYKQRGRTDDARRIILQAIRSKPNQNYGNASYEAYRRIQNAISLGNEIRTLGFPADALRVYQDALSRPADIVASQQYGGSRMKEQLQTGFRESLNALKPEMLPDLLQGPTDLKTGERTGTVDLMLLVESRELDSTTMSSALGRLVQELSKSPEMLQKTRETLDAVLRKHPDDVSALILNTQLAITASDAKESTSLVNALVKFIDQTPLEPVPEKGGFTTQQRESALHQVAFWLVARDCMKQEALRPQGTRLAERALEASRRGTDATYTMAILREWGQIALESGDRQTAEKRWGEMLDIVIPDSTKKSDKKVNRKTSFHGPRPPSADARVAVRAGLSRWEQMVAPVIMGQAGAFAIGTPAAKSKPATPGAKGSVITLQQFDQAAQIARLAANNGLTDLSIKAMSQALHAGPPIENIAIPLPGPGGFPVVSTSSSTEQSSTLQKVETELARLVTDWRRKHVDEATIYRFLKQTVLPETRPLEVFLYLRPLGHDPQTPQSIGLLLAQSAVATKKTDELRQVLASRENQPLGGLSAHVLLAELALATNDTPAAKTHLAALNTLLKQDSLQSTSELACHVAIPALSIPDLRSTALPVFEQAIEHFTQNAMQGRTSLQEEPTRTYRFMLARQYFQQNDATTARKHLEDHLAYLVPLYKRYGGDYGIVRRRAELLRIAAEFAAGGFQSESLEYLAQYADTPVTQGSETDSPGRAAAMILSGLAKMPPDKAYPLLKKWSLPTAERASVRVFAALLPSDQAPPEFDPLRGTVPRGPRDSRIHSTADLLVSFARSAGKLDELRSEIQPHAVKNVEHAPFLLLMTRIAQGEGGQVDADLKALLEEKRKTMPAQGDYQKRPQLVDAVLANYAMRDPALLGVGRDLIVNFFVHCSRVQDHLYMAAARREFNGSVLGPEISHHLDRAPSVTGLKHWTAAAASTAKADASGAQPMWWIAPRGMISHVCGPEQSLLYLKYPLTGSFEISCDGFKGGWAEASRGYGGLAAWDLNYGSETRVFAVGNRSDAINKPDVPDHADKYNRLTVKVRPDKFGFYLNGYLVHEEQSTSTTAPWYFLQSDRVWQTCYRNFQITGDPVIPREVRLSQQDSLLGWSTDFYGESQPSRPATRTPDDQGSYDWWSADGVIQGRLMPQSGITRPGVAQSRLHYCRPLLDGERLTYEFWYEEGIGGCLVHPAFDRLALLLEADGVKQHWMTDGSAMTDSYGGLAPDNVVVDQSIQRGQVALKDRAWNAVEIGMKDGIATVSLNGTVVCERRLETENGRQFGFYHDKNATSVKVRNVVLTGDWPQTLTPEIRSGLLSHEREPSPAERRALMSIIEEKFFDHETDAMLLATRSLPPEERYRELQSWVLPNDDHWRIRLHGETAPADALPVAPVALLPVRLRHNQVAEDPTNPAQRARRQRSGGELISPALDLVVVARELGKLEELAEFVRKIPDTDPYQRRLRLALQVLVAIAGDDITQAAEHLKALTPTRQQGLSDTWSEAERWPELIVAWEASQVPELLDPALALFDLVMDSTNRKNIGGNWEVKVRSARHYALLRKATGAQPPPAAAVSPRRQWSQSTLSKAAGRGAGMFPRWHFQGTEASHLGGNGNDLIYFQSPLRGTFTIEGDLSTFGWREMRVMYGAQWAGPNYTCESADLGNLYSNWTGPKFPAKLPAFGQWCRTKVLVTPASIKYYADDHLIHEAQLTENTDPWLAIHSYGHYGGSLRSLRILGQPEIPTELLLSQRDDLQGWWADMYADPMNGDTAAWKKEGETIVGQKIPTWEGRSKESLLQYHRPLLEDGEITYEFLYIPGQTHVHPALGRMVLLLDAEGVKVHWLTDAQFERTGLALDNSFVEQQYRRGPAALPLKPHEWNKFALNVKGDSITVALNGEQIYERPIDPSNPRTFGLFHYAGDTEVRVRNVVYRGDWPKTLPPINEQELAGNDLELATVDKEPLSATFTWNFVGRLPNHLALIGKVPTNTITDTPAGLKLAHAPNPDVDSEAIGIHWPKLAIGGDFEVTFGYRDFTSKTTSTNHIAPRMEIVLSVGDTYGAPANTHTVALVHRRHHDDSMFLTSLLGIRTNPGAPVWESTEKALVASSGRLRIVRRLAVAYYLYSPVGSEDWVLIDRRPVATTDVEDMLVGLRSEDRTGTSSVVLTELSVRAQRLQYIPSIASGDLPGQITWNMLGAIPKGLRAREALPPNTFEPVEGGLKITRPQDPDQKGTPVGYQWAGKMKGDFELTVGFRDFLSRSDKTDWQIPRFEISITVGIPDSTQVNTAFVAQRQRPDGLTFAGGISEPAEGGQRAWKISDQKTAANSGRMRLIRIGSMIHALAAPAGSDDFVSIASRNVGPGDVRSIEFALRSESLNSTASIILSELSIKAAELESTIDKGTEPLAGPAPFGPNDLPATQIWDFQGTRPAQLHEWGSRKTNSQSAEPDGMKLTRAANVSDSEQGIGYAIPGVSGDFEVTLDYRDFVSTPVLTDWRVPRVDISGTIDSQDKSLLHGMGLAHRRTVKGELKIVATQGDKGGDGKMSYKSAEAPTQRDDGRLRLVRQGTTMFYQTAPLNSENWRTLSRHPIDPGPVTWLTFGVRAEDLEGSVHAVFTKVTIRAKQFKQP